MAVASGPNPTEDAERAERRLPWADEGQDGWLADDLLVVNGTEFIVTPDPDRYLDDQSTERRFLVAKTTAMVRRLELTIVELAPARIVELGIFKGGSAALLASLAAPAKLTAIDLVADPVPALERFIALNGLTDVVAAHYGIDQGDAAVLSALVDADHGAAPLDLVMDDASHLYRETRTSFEVLFPRLRPGGVYIIEDWGWAHFPEPLWQEGGGWFHDRPALTNLVVELLMIAGTGEELISKMTVLRDSLVVVRGPLAVEGSIRLADHYRNRGLPFRPLL
ncbi:MAG TPA: class I SAM-dependent methyltransferase [Solirubrobacteraceae bacterium]